MAYKRKNWAPVRNVVRFREDRSEGGEGKSRGVATGFSVDVMGHARGGGRDQGERADAHSLSASSGGFPLYDGFNSLGDPGRKTRGMTWPEWSRERLIVSFAGIASDQPRSQGGRLGRAGITPRAHSGPRPAFPVSRFLERKGSWQRTSLTCRAAERATRAASQFFALRPRTALLHTSPHPPEHELRRDAG